MKEMSVSDIFDMSGRDTKQVKFDEDKMSRYADLVKIEAKKKKLEARA